MCLLAIMGLKIEPVKKENAPNLHKAKEPTGGDKAPGLKKVPKGLLLNAKR